MRARCSKTLLALVLSLQAASGWAIGFDGVDLEGRPCRGNPQGYGPYDYTNPASVQNNLPVVEQYHFTPQVERLISGKSGFILSDLDYTIRAFPNHHRALFAVIRAYSEPGRLKQRNMGEPKTPPECYLQRAAKFSPKDGKVELLYGLYLHKLGKLDEAEDHYRRAVKLMPRSAEAHYNLGLLLTDQERYADAVPVAKKAYQYGYPLAGLRRRLAAAGHPLGR